MGFVVREIVYERHGTAGPPEVLDRIPPVRFPDAAGARRHASLLADRWRRDGYDVRPDRGGYVVCHRGGDVVYARISIEPDLDRTGARCGGEGHRADGWDWEE